MTSDQLRELIRHHVGLNRFGYDPDGAVIIDASGLELTLSEALHSLSERIAVVQGDLDRESKEAESYHAFWIEERSKRIAAEAAVKAERERCAKIAEPKGPRPCDCEYGACYCRNAGDAAAVASWDADMAVARAIRAPVSGSTEAGNG